MSFKSLPVFSLIPARAGSKGIPNKNICLLAGKPLIEYTISASLQSDIIDRTFVSSDGSNILNVSEQLGAEIINRPAEHATDTASSHQVIEHFISQLDVEDAYIVLLQPTSPLRNAQHIDTAFEQLKSNSADGLISVFPMKNTPYKSYILDENGCLQGLMGNDAPYKRRQDLPDVFYPNGAIYIFTLKDFMSEKTIPHKNTMAYVMPEEISIDIDNANDLEVAQAMIKSGEYNGKAR